MLQCLVPVPHTPRRAHLRAATSAVDVFRFSRPKLSLPFRKFLRAPHIVAQFHSPLCFRIHNSYFNGTAKGRGRPPSLPPRTFKPRELFLACLPLSAHATDRALLACFYSASVGVTLTLNKRETLALARVLANGAPTQPI